MLSTNRSFLTVARNVALLGLLLTVFALAGCSCKEFEDQIVQLQDEISGLQAQVADKEATIAECSQIKEELEANLREAKAENAVLVEQIEEVVYVEIPGEVLFGNSQVMVLDTMVPTLEAIASSIRQHPGWDVFVEGYTDNKKIIEDFQEMWPTNWELGAARASAVVTYLTNEFDLAAERFAAVSYGPFRPVADNDTEDGRAQNRMVRVTMHKPMH